MKIPEIKSVVKYASYIITIINIVLSLYGLIYTNQTKIFFSILISTASLLVVFLLFTHPLMSKKSLIKYKYAYLYVPSITILYFNLNFFWLEDIWNYTKISLFSLSLLLFFYSLKGKSIKELSNKYANLYHIMIYTSSLIIFICAILPVPYVEKGMLYFLATSFALTLIGIYIKNRL